MWTRTSAAIALAMWVMAIPTQADAYPCGNRITMWREPYRVCSFRHVGEIYASQQVARGKTTTPLPYGDQLKGIAYTFKGKTRKLAGYFDRARTTGLIVFKNGRVVYEHYGFGADERSSRPSPWPNRLHRHLWALP